MDYDKYIKHLQTECDLVYEVAQEARGKGYDPKNFVEIPQAHDLADRTQKLLKFLHSRDTASQIRELTESFDGNREMVALEIGKIVSAESYLYGTTMKCPECKGKGVIKKDWREDECIFTDGNEITVTGMKSFKRYFRIFKIICHLGHSLFQIQS